MCYCGLSTILLIVGGCMTIAATLVLGVFDMATHTFAEVFVVGVAMLLVAQLAAWALLQFGWLPYSAGVLCLAAERALFVTVPLSTSTMLLWACYANELVSTVHLPLALAVVLCVQHALFGATLSSSYRAPPLAGDAADTSDLACTPLDFLWQVTFLYYSKNAVFALDVN